jgi:hypothetical protein
MPRILEKLPAAVIILAVLLIACVVSDVAYHASVSP